MLFAHSVSARVEISDGGFDGEVGLTKRNDFLRGTVLDNEIASVTRDAYLQLRVSRQLIATILAAWIKWSRVISAIFAGDLP